MLKMLIVDGNLFDDNAPCITYWFPDIETAMPHIKEAAEQNCWACITEEDYPKED